MSEGKKLTDYLKKIKDFFCGDINLGSRQPETEPLPTKGIDYDELHKYMKQLYGQRTPLGAEIERLQFNNNSLVLAKEHYRKLIAELEKQVAEYEEALQFECGDRCAAGINPCNARTVLDKYKKECK
jgi:hypothetical protein